MSIKLTNRIWNGGLRLSFFDNMGFGKIQFPSWLSPGIIIKGPTQSSDIVKDEKSALPPTRRRTRHPTRRGNQEPTIMNRLSTYLKTKLTSTLSGFEILDAPSIIRLFANNFHHLSFHWRTLMTIFRNFRQ